MNKKSSSLLREMSQRKREIRPSSIKQGSLRKGNVSGSNVCVELLIKDFAGTVYKHFVPAQTK